MILKINFKSEMPIYQQLRNQIVIGIARGELQPGESLPSVRQLAEDIGINMHTVNKAYNILKNEGFLIVHKRRGVLVTEHNEMQMPQFSSAMKELIGPVLAEAFCRGIGFTDVTEVVQQIFNSFKKEN